MRAGVVLRAVRLAEGSPVARRWGHGSLGGGVRRQRDTVLAGPGACGLPDAGLDPGLVPLWFAHVLRDGFALTAMGEFRSFRDVAEQTLHSVGGADLDGSAVRVVLDAMRELEPHPDVEPALRTLREASVPALTLTNGSVEVVSALLRRAGLDGYVERNLSVDAVQRWKPAPEPYLYAADELGVAPGRLALVAAHPWDCAGAQAAGLRSGWVRRGQARWPEVFTAPNVVGEDIPGVIDALLGG